MLCHTARVIDYFTIFNNHEQKLFNNIIRHNKAPFKLLTMGVQDFLQSIRVLPLLWVTWQKLKIKHYCSKSLCMLYPELRGSRLNPFPKLPFWWSSFIVSESYSEAPSGGRHSTALPSYDNYERQQWASCQEFTKGTIVTLTAYCKSKPAKEERVHYWCYNPSQIPVVRGSIKFRTGSTTALS